MKVTNPDGGVGVCVTCFAVIAKPGLTSMSPSTIARGAQTAVTLTGTGFAAGATLKGPAGITFSNVVVQDSTTITATMRATATAPQGANFSVKVVNNASAGYGAATADLLTIS